MCTIVVMHFSCNSETHCRDLAMVNKTRTTLSHTHPHHPIVPIVTIIQNENEKRKEKERHYFNDYLENSSKTEEM